MLSQILFSFYRLIHVFIKYKWIPQKIITNIIFEKNYVEIVIPEKIEYISRNLIGYQKIIPKKIIKKEKGIIEKKQILYIDVKWE